MKRLLLVLALIVAVSASLASPASAHSGNQSYLYVDVAPNAVGGRIEIPTGDLYEVTGLELVGDDEEIEALLEAEQEAINRYLTEHVLIGADGTSYDLSFDTPFLFFSDLPEQSDNYVVVTFTADTGGADVPRNIEITLDPFFDEIPGRDALLLIGNDWAGGVIDNGHEVNATFDAGSRTQAIDLGDTGWHKTVGASVKLGVNHIKSGPDHILFVLVLLLPSVLILSAMGWDPAPSFGSALWRVLKVVTMFTLAHSITLTLAGLDLLPLPPSKFVEAVIAVSIAAAALHNIWPITRGREWTLAFVFGLFHGMGFASLVEGLDVPRSTQLLSLLGRNIGIEAGQTVVVLLSFPFLFLLRRTRYYRPFFVAASVALATVSVGWMIERIGELDLGVSDAIAPLVKWPNVVGYLAVLTVAAAAAFLIERRAERLVATPQT